MSVASMLRSVAVLAMVGVFNVGAVNAAHVPTPVNCQNDIDGPNDQPGQKDITRYCTDIGDGAPWELIAGYNWDDTTLTGNNTGDICTLYDTNGDGLVNLAACVTLESSGAANGNLAVFREVRLFTCTDKKGDRCTDSELVAGPYSTVCEASQQQTDPFGPNVQNGPGDEYPDDTEILCGVDLNDFGALGAQARLIDACSYPSRIPNSDPSDCILFKPCTSNAQCDDGNPCTTDTCAVAAGICQHTPKGAGASCDNGLFCDGADTCNELGFCKPPATPRDCSDEVDCTVDACDELDDVCVHDPRNSRCDNGAYCDGVETCDAVKGCQAGTPVNCNDNIGCTADSCNESGKRCDHVPNNGECNDGRYCNGVETCDVLQGCKPGTPPNCNDGVACTTDACNDVTGECTHTPSHTYCDDEKFCNGVETCDVLQGCKPGTPPDCRDSVDCTTDSCDEATDSCAHTPNNAYCDDRQFCNGTEICDALEDCKPGTPPDCNDSVDCTNDSCNETTDTCDNVPDNGRCEDELFCNGVEICDRTEGCRPGTDPCVGAYCDEPNRKCVNCLTDVHCDNSVFCDGHETCVAGVCEAGTPPDCSDGVFCTHDECDEGTDRCVNTPSDAACDDHRYCTGTETCDPHNDCQPGTPLDCNDGVDCTKDECNDITETCDNTPDDTRCDNGQYCDGVETCDATNDCRPGTPPDCNDGVSCTDDSCNDSTASCDHVPDNTKCDDATFCNGQETCDANNGCVAGSPPPCKDEFNCTLDTCDTEKDQCLHDFTPCVCGDGVKTGEEECDPPTPPGTFEDCNNGIDDDGDRREDCRDRSCGPHSNRGPICDQSCKLDALCAKWIRDPARIQFRWHGEPDWLWIHGRFPIRGNPDPLRDGMVFQLSNKDGAIYRAYVGPGEFRGRPGGKRFQFFDNDPRIFGSKTKNGGLSRAFLFLRRRDGMRQMSFRIRLYADLKKADQREMTGQIVVGEEVGSLTAEWKARPSRWTLRQGDF